MMAVCRKKRRSCFHKRQSFMASIAQNLLFLPAKIHPWVSTAPESLQMWVGHGCTSEFASKYRRILRSIPLGPALAALLLASADGSCCEALSSAPVPAGSTMLVVMDLGSIANCCAVLGLVLLTSLSGMNRRSCCCWLSAIPWSQATRVEGRILGDQHSLSSICLFTCFGQETPTSSATGLHVSHALQLEGAELLRNCIPLLADRTSP